MVILDYLMVIYICKESDIEWTGSVSCLAFVVMSETLVVKIRRATNEKQCFVPTQIDFGLEAKSQNHINNYYFFLLKKYIGLQCKCHGNSYRIIVGLTVLGNDQLTSHPNGNPIHYFIFVIGIDMLACTL